MAINPYPTKSCPIERAAGRREMPNFVFTVKGFKPSQDGERPTDGEYRTWFYSAKSERDAKEYAERDRIQIQGDIVQEGRTSLESGRAYSRSEIDKA